MKLLKTFGMFWYDFIIGDDWKIAVAVGAALGITGGVMAIVDDNGGSLTSWTLLGAGLVFVLFTITLFIDARPKTSRK